MCDSSAFKNVFNDHKCAKNLAMHYGYLLFLSALTNKAFSTSCDDIVGSRVQCLYVTTRGVDNRAAGAAAAAPIIWLVVVIQKWRTFRRPKLSLPLWIQFEIILAWQITSGSMGHGPMIFMPKILYILIFCSLRSIFHFIKKKIRMWLKTSLKYIIL